eukprot:1160563-Pelagomonas_calceolata.AAC.5
MNALMAPAFITLHSSVLISACAGSWGPSLRAATKVHRAVKLLAQLRCSMYAFTLYIHSDMREWKPLYAKSKGDYLDASSSCCTQIRACNGGGSLDASSPSLNLFTQVHASGHAPAIFPHCRALISSRKNVVFGESGTIADT